MATLIQSKQIQGIVTASVVQGDFQVSGSLIVTGSGIFTSDVTASGQVSASRVLGVRYDDISGTPNFVAGTGISISQTGDNITITNTGGVGGGSTDITSLNAFTASYFVDSASFDSRITGISASGSGADWNTNLQNIPSGLISGSVLRTLDGTGVVSGSSQISFTGITNVPSGLVSSSTQITDGSGIVSGSVVRTLDGTGVVSGSVLRSLDGTGVLSASVDFNTYSASVATTIDNIVHTSIPSGTISGSQQISDLGFVTSSVITSEPTDITTLNQFTSSIQSQVDALINATSSYLTSETDNQTLSIVGDQLTISGGNTVTIPTGSGSGTSDFTQLTNIPSGLVSGSSQVDITQTSGYNTFSSSIATAIDNIQHTQIPSGTVSSSAQIESVIDDTYISASAARSGFGSAGGSGADWNSNLQNIPSGLVSSSEQITLAGVDGFSSYFTSVNNAQIAQDARLTSLESFTASLDSTYATDSEVSSLSASIATTIDGIVHTQIPSGTISGSSQVDFTQISNIPSGLVSSSVQITDGSGIVSGSVVRTLAGSGIVSQSSQISAFNTFLEINGDGVVSGSVLRTLDGTGVISGSILPGVGITINSSSGDYVISSSFNGNRIVSNTDLPSGVYNTNFGTSGSVQDFLNAVFFPNSAPVITTGNQTIEEFRTSGASIVTLSGTDAEGQAITWGTSSAYTDDLIRVATNGVMTLNETATSASFNTDLISGTTYGHGVIVTATDTFDTTTEKTIYIIVTPNEAPKFRETSVSGNVITSVTQAVNENSTNGTLIKRIYFTDSESDAITIYSSSISPSNHFTITKSSTYVDITQNTSSLDYENVTQYTFSISASDEHYPGQDSNSITYLPITINVTDNIVPSISNQTISGLNENSSNGASAGSISATDNEGDAITFVSFDLHKLLLDGVEVSSGSYGGTSQSDPHENPFQMDSSGNVTRKTGVYINSDLINSYQYRVKVRDNFNSTNSTAGIITIPITDDTAPTISVNGTFRIVESATSGDLVRTSTNGYSGTQARLTSNQSVTWSDDSGMISINGSGYISLSSNVDGVYTSGQSFTVNVTATNSFGTTTTQTITIYVVANAAPTITFTNQTANFETELALSGVTMVSMSVTDQEGDTPYSASLTGTDASSFQLVYTNANSSSIGLQASTNLSAGTYSYDIKVTDNYGKSTTYSGRSITITTSADYGKTYIYRSNYAVGSLSAGSYLSLMGASSVSGDTPPEVTGYTANSLSPFRLISSSLGDSTLTLAGGATATLIDTLSGSTLDSIISAANPLSVGGVSEQYIIIVPSGSDMAGVPTSMTDGFGDNTTGRYVMAINADGGGWGAEPSIIHLLDTSGSVNGYDKHFVIGRTGANAASNIQLRIIPASGSLPS